MKFRLYPLALMLGLMSAACAPQPAKPAAPEPVAPVTPQRGAPSLSQLAEVQGVGLAGRSLVAVSVIGNTASMIYHEPACEWAKKIRTRRTFGSASLARARGFRPCRVCNPT